MLKDCTALSTMFVGPKKEWVSGRLFFAPELLKIIECLVVRQKLQSKFSKFIQLIMTINSFSHTQERADRGKHAQHTVLESESIPRIQQESQS